MQADLLLWIFLYSLASGCERAEGSYKCKLGSVNLGSLEEDALNYAMMFTTAEDFPRTFNSVPDQWGRTQSLCGIVPNQMSMLQAIVQGKDALSAWWPWQAFIRSGSSFCGGVLIASNWVLTAAHCIEAREQMVVLGKDHLQVWSQHQQVRFVHEKWIHPHYDSTRWVHDIGLLKLQVAVEETDYVRPVCLPERNYDFSTARVCYVTGWGMYEPGLAELSMQLKELRVLVMPHSQCHFLFALGGRRLTLGQTCLLDTTGSKSGICRGDSGGPLSCQLKERYYVAGIASFVEKGCEKHIFPDVFSNVSAYIDWIVFNIHQNS